MSSNTRERSVVQSSELSRASAEVFAAAADHPVRVTRRDGEALVLMSERQDRDRDALLELAAQLIAVATDTRGTLAGRMADRFPWMLALSEQDRAECAAAVIDAARAAFATNQPALAVAELTAWRETATALAAGLGSEPVTWLEASELVERP